MSWVNFGDAMSDETSATFKFNNQDFRALGDLLSDEDAVRDLERVISLLKSSLGPPGKAFSGLPTLKQMRTKSKRLALAAERFQKELNSIDSSYVHHFESFVVDPPDENGDVFINVLPVDSDSPTNETPVGALRGCGA